MTTKKQAAKRDYSCCNLDNRKIVGPSVHLLDILAALSPGNPQCWKDKNSLERLQGAFNLTLTIINREWEGLFDRELLEAYSASLSMRRPMKEINGVDPSPPSEKPYDIVDAQIRRLHKEGLTAEILAAIRKDYPDVAKATGLSKASAANAVDSQNPPTRKESSHAPQHVQIINNYGALANSTTGDAVAQQQTQSVHTRQPEAAKPLSWWQRNKDSLWVKIIGGLVVAGIIAALSWLRRFF